MGNKSDKCSSCKNRIRLTGWVACDGCLHNEGLEDRHEPMTNADRIRNMTDEELAERISRMANCVYCPIRCGIFGTLEECKDMWLSWLRSPVEETE